ncbi:MAG: hypothetical protein ACREMO_09335 [Gemmatimonadales bacterium]
MKRACFVLFGLGLFPATALWPQVADQGTLIIRLSGHEIGREDFRVQPARQGRASGDSLITTARYPEVRPQAELRAALERSSSAGFSFHLDLLVPQGASQIYASGGRNRVTVRSVARGSETGREYPGGSPLVILDDSLFALFLPAADLATEAGQRITAIYPRTGRRLTFLARRRGPTARVGEADLILIQFTGDLEGSLYLDAQGRLARVVFPGTATEATRVPN